MRRLKKYIREPVNGLTHGSGIVLSVAALFFLLNEGFRVGTGNQVVAFAIFGICMILLYTASTLYHSLKARDKTIRLLQKVDHSMIYIMIAGSYTPICLIVLQGTFRWLVLGIVWMYALAGILKKFFWKNPPPWLSIVSYLLMGWMGVLLLPALLERLPQAFFYWLLAGGIAYSAGTLFLGFKKPVLVPGWVGPHEIWHLFVMAGTFSHFWAFYLYLPGFGL